MNGVFSTPTRTRPVTRLLPLAGVFFLGFFVLPTATYATTVLCDLDAIDVPEYDYHDRFELSNTCGFLYARSDNPVEHTDGDGKPYLEPAVIPFYTEELQERGWTLTGSIPEHGAPDAAPIQLRFSSAQFKSCTSDGFRSTLTVTEYLEPRTPEDELGPPFDNSFEGRHLYVLTKEATDSDACERTDIPDSDPPPEPPPETVEPPPEPEPPEPATAPPPETATPQPKQAQQTTVVPSLPVDELPTAEALIDDDPLGSACGMISLSLDELNKDTERDHGTVQVTYLVGIVDVLLPGEDEPREVKEGDVYLEGTVIFTGSDSSVLLWQGDHHLAKLDSLSQVTIHQDGLFLDDGETRYRSLSSLGECDIQAIDIEIEEVGIRSDMKVKMPNTTASPTGTDFTTSYRANTGDAIIEVYDGSVEVENEQSGEVIALAAAYGSDIRRVEIADDGTMVEKIAVQPSTVSIAGYRVSQTAAFIGGLVLLVLIAGGYLFYRRGRSRRRVFRKR